MANVRSSGSRMGWSRPPPGTGIRIVACAAQSPSSDSPMGTASARIWWPLEVTVRATAGSLYGFTLALARHPAPAQEGSRMRLGGILFDAYGTLFDVHSVVEAGRAVTDDPQALSALWRAKQLEYTWLRTLMGRYE